MPFRRILPGDSLETGFRAIYNQTVDSIIDATQCACDESGVISFYNDEGVLLGQLDLSPYFKLKNEVDAETPGGIDYNSATEDNEGVIKLATPDEAYDGVEEFKALSPATLAYVLQLLKFGKQSIDDTLKVGNVSDEDARFGSLGVNRLPRDVNAPLDVTVTIINGVRYFTHRLPEDSVNIFYPIILNKLIEEGRLSGGGGGAVAFTPEFWEALWQFTYKYDAFQEGRLDTKPDYPTTGGTSPVAAKINANLSKYEPDSIGLTILLNGSNGENFMGQVIGTNGVAAPDQSWHLLSRIDGTFANGTYSLPYYDLPSGGFLAAGAYKARVRIGVDNSTIVEREIVVASNVPVGKGVYRIVGPASIPQNVINAHYVLQEQYTDNSWREVTNLPTVWVILENIPGLGVAGGNVSGGPGIVSADTIFTLVCSIGINIELKVLLTFETGETPPDPVVKIINAVFGRDDSYQGRLALANVNGPVQVMRSTYKLVNGLESLVSQSNWFNADKIDGDYNSGGATVQHVWGFEKPSAEGTYHIYDRWRPANSTDESTYKTLTPYYTVVVASAAAILKVAYTWQKNNPSGGQPSRMQLLLTVTDSDFEVAFQSTYDGVASAKSTYATLNQGSYASGYNRQTEVYGAGSRTSYIAFLRKVGTTVDLLTISIPSLPDSGTIALTQLYPASNQNTEWEYDND